MIRVCILGTGNLATHLFDAFLKARHVKVVQVVGRNEKALRNFQKWTETTSNFMDIVEADVYFIAVKDDAIFEVSQYLKHLNGLVVHTSGSVSIYTLSGCKNYGVFYTVTDL